MNAIINESRRGFLKTSVLAGGGLVVGFMLPATARMAAAAPQAFSLNAYLRIGSDNSVTILCGLSEMGQGVHTAIPMLIAEELDADWSKIRVEQAPTDSAFANPLFGIQATGGSSAVRGHWLPMRQAGATARAMLVQAAALAWKVDPSTCRTDKGEVIHASGKRLSYGKLAQDAGKLAVPAAVPLKDASLFRILGKGAKRVDTAAKVTGQAKFGLDMALPGMLTAVIAHSPVIGGRKVSFNADKAKAVPGVKQIIAIPSGIAVLAQGYWAAKQGRDLLEVQWDEGANATLSTESIRAELLAAASQPALVARKDGDVQSAAAAKKIAATYEAPYLAHACMEPMNCTAWHKGDTLDIWASTQAPGLNRNVLSKVVELAPEKITVNTLYLGGGFGRRFAQDFVIDAAILSKIARAPVKLVYSREDDTRALFYRPASVCNFSGGLDDKGAPVLFTARSASSSIALAAQMPLDKGMDGFAVEGIRQMPYSIANVQVEWAQKETPIGVWFWRSVGHSQNIYFVESFIDEMAALAGKDPFLFRRDLLGQSPRYKAVLELAAAKASWGKPLPAGHFHGIAVGESFGSYVAEVAEVSVAKNGEVRVHKVTCAVDCGMTVNPDIVKRQMESAIVYGLSAALHGKISIKNGRIEQGNFDQYPVLRMSEAPQVDVHIVASKEPPGGVGEPGLPPLAPAVVNAIFAATGKRLRKLPIDPAELIRA
jgi:isoquinoline 1-oxidoreductase beta subunit